MLVIKAGIQEMLVRIANRSDQTACFGLFGRQVVFEILENLP